MRIAALDPGGTTGLAILDTPATVVLLHQSKDLDDVLDTVWAHRPDELVIEKFIIYPEAGRYVGWSGTPAEVVGFIKAEAAHRGVEVVEQLSSVKHGGHKLIRPLGLWKPGNRHAMDALAHALYRSLYGHGYAEHPAVQERLKVFLAEG